MATTTQAVLCPQCQTHKTDFVFLPEGGARCTECNDAGMLSVVRAWRDGELHAVLAAGLAKYISGQPA
jgi:hypothetical protein